MELTLKDYPKSHTNNSREIVKKALIRMKNFPSSMQAQKLEDNYGIISDWSDADYGEPPHNSQTK